MGARKKRSSGGRGTSRAGKTRAAQRPLEIEEALSAKAGRERIHRFDPSKLDRTVIALPLIERFHEASAPSHARRASAMRFGVMIDLNLDYEGGRDHARSVVIDTIAELVHGDSERAAEVRALYRAQLERLSPLQYVAARLTENQIVALVEKDVKRAQDSWRARCIYRIWPDFEASALLTSSVRTINADKAGTSFGAFGQGIVWAVIDSGIDASHPHFAKYRNLDVNLPIAHRSFLDDINDDPLCDHFGHGTHVAGIIGGALTKYAERQQRKGEGELLSAHGSRVELGDERSVDFRMVRDMSGVAPECKLVSLKVLDEHGTGPTTAIMRALQTVNEINQGGRRLLIHGVNMSLGYDFDPEWFACGQSPLCVEVDRLVRSGVLVVVAAGNSGYGFQSAALGGVKSAGLTLSINDPGNADAAITVGATHKDLPRLYGASYFSSKGPTGDGRHKPDVLAPGEKIVSCATGFLKHAMLSRSQRSRAPLKVRDQQVAYIEHTGTSAAAAHVSGALACFLSARRIYIGQPELVKSLLLQSATDLGRDRAFQGSGLVDTMALLAKS